MCITVSYLPQKFYTFPKQISGYASERNSKVVSPMLDTSDGDWADVGLEAFSNKRSKKLAITFRQACGYLPAVEHHRSICQRPYYTVW